MTGIKKKEKDRIIKEIKKCSHHLDIINFWSKLDTDYENKVTITCKKFGIECKECYFITRFFNKERLKKKYWNLASKKCK